MSKPSKATMSTLGSEATANPRRTTLASVEDFADLPGAVASQQPREYASELPTVTANPRRTQLMVAPAPRLPQD
ncbi:hypothetical protein [Kitasatospora sp. NPDC051914]|uniref:hypothetical protein n=1 Tax=Kitasatospora sp. NPDC051914 TaxID=3154945 RepID=UPI003434D267